MQIYWNKRKSLHKDITTKRFISDRTNLEHQHAQPPFQCFGTQFWPEKKSPSYYGRCDIIWEYSMFLMGSLWTYQQMLFQSWLVYVLHKSPPTPHLDVLQSFLFYDTLHWLFGWDSWNLKQSRKVSQNIKHCFPYHNHNRVNIICHNQLVSRCQ